MSTGINGDPDDYSSIDIQPGYQKLCGHNQSVRGALPFVRFRHTDSDFVREARQQDFLRWAKQGYPLSRLVANRDKLLRIFANHSTLDQNLHSEDGLLDLVDLVLNADSSSLKQIAFPGEPVTIGDGDYVTATHGGEAAIYRQFMRATPKSAAPAAHHRTRRRSHGSSRRGRATIDVAGLSADPGDGLEQAGALTHPGMPVYYPRLIASDSAYCMSATGNCVGDDEPPSAYLHSYPRQYLVPTTGGHKVPAYRMTLEVDDTIGEYYGVQGVRWSDPPLLSGTSTTVRFRGRALHAYEDDGGHITTVAWHVGPNTYWISNTLTSNIPNHQMIAIAGVDGPLPTALRPRGSAPECVASARQWTLPGPRTRSRSP